MNVPPHLGSDLSSSSPSSTTSSGVTPASSSVSSPSPQSSSPGPGGGGSLRGLGPALRQLQQHQRRRNFLLTLPNSSACSTPGSTMLLSSAQQQHDHHLNFVMGFIKEDEIYSNGGVGGGGGTSPTTSTSSGTGTSSIVSSTTDTSSEDNSLVVCQPAAGPAGLAQQLLQLQQLQRQHQQQQQQQVHDDDTGGSSNTLKVLSTNSTSDIHSSRSSLASFDAAIGKSYDQEDQTRNTLCRVILSNGATTVVQTRSNETIKELVERLLEKRGIVYTAYEAFLAGNHKPLDLDGPSSSLAGREVNIDQRVVFKLSLPNRKMISVKSKATKPLGDVLRPILLKYNYELDQMNVYSKEAYLDMTYPVTSVDGLWLQVRNGNENDFHQDLTRTIASRSERAYANQVPPLPIIATSQHAQIINHFQQQLQSSQHNGFLNNNNVTKKSQLAYGSQSHHNLKGKDEQPADAAAAGGKQELNMLDEITNKVFNELMNGKIANGPKVPAEDCTSDSSSTRRGDRFRRRGSNAPSESGRGAKSKKCSTAGSEDGGESVGNAVTGVKKPIIAKLKAGVKLQIPTRSQNDELLEGLKRAQRSRLEDQRGTEINFELPDFLKDKENFTSTTTTTAGSSSAATAMAAPSSKFTRKFAKRPESAEFPLGASTNGGSLQQIHKPQPAPRLSISRGAATGATGAGNPSSPPVQSASSESNLNNLSLRCNASPLTLDDNGNGSQSENSYAGSFSSVIEIAMRVK